jgi:putative addiction module component (TIGR02574 family)
MAGDARKLFADAMTLSIEERASLVDDLIATLPMDADASAEIERRARRAQAEPDGGEAWDAVERRLRARVSR